MSSIFLEKEDFERIFRDYLKIDDYSMPILSLFSERQFKRTNYKPHYQRNYVWDKHKASYFIESILLGTEIPPLVFFKNGSNIEVIDGRQRFETIYRFKSNQLTLTKLGLSILKQLAKSTYGSLRKEKQGMEITNTFLSTNIRIIEFQITSDLKVDKFLEDKIKKEIFRRYNSGITPLKKYDIDNAIYVDDEISIYFKHLLKENAEFKTTMFELFFLNEAKKNRKPHIGKMLQFIRKHIVLGNIPIIYYARGNYRVEIIAKLYEKLVNESNEIDLICSNFRKKVQIVDNIRKVFRQKNYQHNRLVYECLLWSLTILEKENVALSRIEEEQVVQNIGQRIYDNLDIFTEIESHYYTKIVARFMYMSKIINDLFGLSLDMYVCASSQATNKIKKLREHEPSDTITKLGELASLRTTKPAPSRISICDLSTIMDLRKFVIRPAYQRDEVINISKASALIESILLEIHLPPIFIFKRIDNTLEVIDGQQRLLTILGYMGAKYLDENGNLQEPKNYNFALKGLNILDELNRKKFDNLSTKWQDKFWDFKLSIVEIEECLNPEFNPVDLFVRLNYKPYPIEENSFEMWNSWVDKDIIDRIKQNLERHKHWFFIRAYKNSDGSRMENEELYTSLAYLERKTNEYKDAWDYLYLYEPNNRISIRINQSKEITKLLELASQDEREKQKFVDSIKRVESFIFKLKLVLLDVDIEDEQKKQAYFQSELNSIFKAQRNLRRYKRAKQDFYLLWYLLSPINLEMVSYHRIQLKQDIKDIFGTLRKLNFERPKGILSDKFREILDKFHQKYAQSKRKLKLTEAQKKEMIARQNNIDPISGAPIFIGDEIQTDHIKPIAIGGEDSMENIQLSHKFSNLRKGAKYRE